MIIVIDPGNEQETSPHTQSQGDSNPRPSTQRLRVAASFLVPSGPTRATLGGDQASLCLLGAGWPKQTRVLTSLTGRSLSQPVSWASWVPLAHMGSSPWLQEGWSPADQGVHWCQVSHLSWRFTSPVAKEVETHRLRVPDVSPPNNVAGFSHRVVTPRLFVPENNFIPAGTVQWFPTGRTEPRMSHDVVFLDVLFLCLPYMVTRTNI